MSMGSSETRASDRREHPELRQLGADDYPSIISLRDEVIDRLPDPDFYIRERDEPSFVRGHLGPCGISIGFESEGSLMAYAALTIDLDRSPHEPEVVDAICTRLELRHESTTQSCVLAVAMILPEYQRNGIHRRAIEWRVATARSLGKRRVFALASPRNEVALQRLMMAGLSRCGIVEFSDGRVRELLEASIDEEKAES